MLRATDRITSLCFKIGPEVRCDWPHSVYPWLAIFPESFLHTLVAVHQPYSKTKLREATSSRHVFVVSMDMKPQGTCFHAMSHKIHSLDRPHWIIDQWIIFAQYHPHSKSYIKKHLWYISVHPDPHHQINIYFIYLNIYRIAWTYSLVSYTWITHISSPFRDVAELLRFLTRGPSTSGSLRASPQKCNHFQQPFCLHSSNKF